MKMLQWKWPLSGLHVLVCYLALADISGERFQGAFYTTVSNALLKGKHAFDSFDEHVSDDS